MDREDSRFPALALAATALGCLIQAARAYSALPARVASHFGASGLPDGWAPKGGFLGLYAALVVLQSVAIAGVASAVKRAPNERVNLPHKDYWLAPARREETMAAIGAYLRWFGAATNLLMLDIFHQAIRVNLGLAPRLEHPLSSLAVYLIFMAAWLAALVSRFARKAV